MLSVFCLFINLTMEIMIINNYDCEMCDCRNFRKVFGVLHVCLFNVKAFLCAKKIVREQKYFYMLL